MNKKIIVVIGASGAIGSALVALLADRPGHQVFAFARTPVVTSLPGVAYGRLDYDDPQSIADCAAVVAAYGAPDVLINAAGLLHAGDMLPEKSLRDVTPENLHHVFQVNTVGPALVMKHFLPIMPRDRRYVMAALSARVGSMADNLLGGWYAYRASKAALNMVIKTTSVEAARRNKQAVIVGLHPGTVKSNLSKPFQDNVAADKLFTPAYAAGCLLQVVDQCSPDDTGKIFAWDGQVIPY